MTHTRSPWMARFEGNAARTIVRDRNRPIVLGLIIVMIMLTASGFL